ncbi:MAG TPA: class I SAM-dependent methyltransferase, partial [Roseiflexaceae bacterium]|nr:class I SAM-dependent methyltransferase [Roseiflexaceae bacterium]
MDSTQRFSSRVENYVKYRPSYPQEIIAALQQACGLTSDSIVADVGSGTGIFAELLLRNGNTVYGIEPNQAMRAAGEQLLQHFPRFHSVNGTAEATTLPAQSVDFITAGQAFHWFDPDRARREFARILRPGGWVALIWNERRSDSTPFLRDYEQLLRTYGTDYEASKHTNFDAELIRAFFAPNPMFMQTFENQQRFDYDGLRGRLLSSSYTP